MSLEKTQGYAEAVKALEANQSPRYKRLSELEAYVAGTQYAGRPDWFSDEKPLWERAPCIVYPIVQSAIDSNVDLLLGENRFPLVGVEGFEGEDGDEIEKALARIVTQARLKSAAREVFASAQGSSSACAIFGIRAGRLFIDAVRAKWCEVTLDAEGAVTKLTIQYPYLTTEKVGGQHQVKAKLYKRVIDAQRDVTYLPGDANENGTEPSWTEDPSKSVSHGLGFCPVVWYAHMKGCSVYGEVDGRAIHEHLTDEILAHDFALSQRHRAALYAGDPLWTEVGVDVGYSPTAPVRKAEVPASTTGSPNEKPHAAYVSRPARGKARKKSPGTAWQYPEGVEVKLHTLPGEALDAIDKNARDIRIKLAESLGVVFLDPETIPQASTLSGRALEALKSRQLDRCDNYRADFGDKFLLPALGMLIRIAIAKKLFVEGLEAIEKQVAKFADRWSWVAPPLTLSWGRYFRLDSDEEAKTVELVAKAKDAGLTTKRAAIEKLRGVFDYKDVDAVLNELDDEADEAMKRQQQMAADMMMGSRDPDGEDDDAGKGPRPPGRRGARKARAKDEQGAAEDGA